MAAPKHNLYALGNNGGRPAHYDTPEALEAKAIEYFELSMNASGKCQPTMDGLTFHVGFAHRQSWQDYSSRSKEFSDMVGRLKMFVRSCYEKQLYGFAWAGAAFALKNIGQSDWKDEVIQNQNQTVTNVTITEKKRED